MFSAALDEVVGSQRWAKCRSSYPRARSRRAGAAQRASGQAAASPPPSSQILHSPQDIEFYIYTNNYIILI